MTIFIFHLIYSIVWRTKDYEVQDDLLSDKGNSIFELEPKFNESYRNQDWCSTKTRNTMHRHTCVRWFSESVF